MQAPASHPRALRQLSVLIQDHRGRLHDLPKIWNIRSLERIKMNWLDDLRSNARRRWVMVDYGFRLFGSVCSDSYRWTYSENTYGTMNKHEFSFSAVEVAGWSLSLGVYY